MLLLIFIIGTLAIGWYVPQIFLNHARFRFAGVFAVVIALLLGALFIWLGAQVFGALGLGDPKTEFDRGFSAWKIMLLVAPASALQAVRRANKDKP